MRRRRGEAPRDAAEFLRRLTAAGLGAAEPAPLRPIQPLVVGDHLGPLLRRQERFDAWLARRPAAPFAAQLAKCLQRQGEAALAKPVLAVLGQSDAGKSRLINALLGAEYLTASWTPTTTIPVFIKHCRERPAWMGEDEAWVFGGDWEPSRWREQEYALSRKLAGGERQVLYQWGTRQGGRGLGMAGAAILFAESDLLLSVDVVDLPGLGAPERPAEEGHARAALRWADAILYLSPANSFMKATDLAFLAEAMRALRGAAPWESVCVVATQAGGVEGGNRETLSRILELGAGRLAHVLLGAGVPGLSAGGAGPTAEREALTTALRPRFFTYALERPELRAELEGALPPLLGALPKARALLADQTLPDLLSAARAELATERERLTAALISTEAHRWVQPEERQATARALRTALGQAVTASRQQFLTEASSVLAPSAIRALIEQQRLRPTEAPEALPAILGLRLQRIAEGLLQQCSTTLFTALDGWAALLPPTSVGFDPGRAIAEGLAGAPALGLIGLWRSAGRLQLPQPESVLQPLRPVVSGSWAGRLGGLLTRLVGGSDWAERLAQQVASQAVAAGTAEQFAAALLDSAWAETEAGLAALTLSVEESVAAWAASLAEPPGQADHQTELAALGAVESWLEALG